MKESLWINRFILVSCLFFGMGTLKDKACKTPSQFYLFGKIHWPSHVHNECVDPNDCCKLLKHDSGGFTCYGIAVKYNKRFFYLFQENYYYSPIANFEQMIQIEVKRKGSKEVEPYAREKIYKDYFRKPGFDKLPNAFKQPVFDFGVHSGPRRAIRFLQSLVGVKQDSILGKQTLGKLEAGKYDPQVYNDMRHKWIRKIPAYKNFPRGFENRIKKIKKQTGEAVKVYSGYQCPSKTS